MDSSEGQDGQSFSDQIEPMNESLQENEAERENQLLRNFGVWQQEEQIKYAIFAQIHKAELQSRRGRKHSKIFKVMSQFLKTRDAIQCRSHHMKQLKTLKNIKNIVKKAKTTIGEETYKNIYEQIILHNPGFIKTSDYISQESGQRKIQINTKEMGIQANEDDIEVMNNIQTHELYVPIIISPSPLMLPYELLMQFLFMQKMFY